MLYLGRGLAKATLFGPGRGGRDTTACPSIGPAPAYAELALLRGDPSDGLPGVPGIGEKTAATLLAQHGSLEDILAAAHDPKSKMAKGVSDEAAGGAPTTSRRPSRWCGWPPTPPSPSRRKPTRCRWPPPHPRKVAELAEQYGVDSSIGRLQKALDALPGD